MATTDLVLCMNICPTLHQQFNHPELRVGCCHHQRCLPLLASFNSKGNDETIHIHQADIDRITRGTYKEGRIHISSPSNQAFCDLEMTAIDCNCQSRFSRLTST